MPVSEEDSSMALNDAEYPSTAADEKRAIGRFLDAAESQIKEGDRHYLISYRWWKQWKAYVGDDAGNSSSKTSNGGMIESRRPSSIDNSNLLCPTKDKCDHDNELREALKENYDYILVPEQVWIAYHKWYGGGPAIVRKVINTGSVHEDSLEVEVYPLRLRLISSTRGNEVVLKMSKKSSVGELYHKVCKVFDLSLEHIRLWDYKGRRKNFLLSDARQTLQEAKLQMDHDILLEVKIEGSWPDDARLQHENGYIRNELALVPVEPSRLGLSIAGGPTGSRKSSSTDLIYSQSLSSSFKSFEGGIGFNNENARAGPLGLTGLQNLGNTCFMNSAIQCLAHTPELVEFFLQDYSQEINRQNPLGMEGELAIAFGDLLRKLWAEGRTPIAPRAFKAKLARFAPQFSGYNQHDSQELLAFLLDGLHEDLNRVKLKPYLESKDADGRPDGEVAHEYWENHKARNDSIIVDICQGQYKSTLVCPFCNKVSVTFDPFMYLSLPLPSTTTRPITVTLFSCNGDAPPTPYTIPVSRQARCKEVIQVLGKACQLQNDEKLLLMESYNRRSYRFLDEFLDWISTARDDANLTAYRLTKGSEKAPLLVFANRCFEEDVMAIQRVRQLKHFGVPFIAPLPEEGLHTGAELLGVFESLLRPFKNIEQLPVLNNSEKEHLQNGISNDVHDLEMMDLEDSVQKDDVSIDNVDTECQIANANGFLEQSAQLFQLSLLEEKNMGRDGLIYVEDRLPPAFNSSKISSKIHLTVDWSEDALKKYNIKLLEALPEVQKSGLPAKKARQEAVSLYTCLEAFLKEEPLGPEDMWYCPRCKEHRQASKKLDLWRLPEILVVHLKRFSYSRFSKNKLETFVNFPINDLDLTKYIAHKDDKQSYRYELYAVSNHYGSMGGGHYTAYAKLIDGKQWYNFDDSYVSPVNEDEIMTAAAYVLFYRRIQTTNGSVSNGCTMLINPQESLPASHLQI